MNPAPGTFLLGGDLPVSRLGLGTIQFTGDPDRWGPPADPAGATEVLRTAVELGVTHIDTADCYGPHTCEELIADALHPYDDSLVLATKGGIRRTHPGEWDHYGHPEYLTTCIEHSLTRLRRDTIDLYYLHRIDPRIPLADQLGALIDAHQHGKIRHIGLSKVTVAQLRHAQSLTPIAAVQNYTDPANPDIEVRELCRLQDIAYVPYRPFDGGRRLHGTEQPQPAVKELFREHLRDGPHTLLIPGTRSMAHLRQNVKSFTENIAEP